MNRDDLVEMVAEELCRLDEQNGAAPWGWYPDNHKHQISKEWYRERARAALAIIDPAMREQCAKVVDDYEAQTVIGDGGGLEDESVWSAASSIAAAIRAGAKP